MMDNNAGRVQKLCHRKNVKSTLSPTASCRIKSSISHYPGNNVPFVKIDISNMLLASRPNIQKPVHTSRKQSPERNIRPEKVCSVSYLEMCCKEANEIVKKMGRGKKVAAGGANAGDAAATVAAAVARRKKKAVEYTFERSPSKNEANTADFAYRTYDNGTEEIPTKYENDASDNRKSKAEANIAEASLQTTKETSTNGIEQTIIHQLALAHEKNEQLYLILDNVRRVISEGLANTRTVADDQGSIYKSIVLAIMSILKENKKP